jgi:phosphoserine aminotransferase
LLVTTVSLDQRIFNFSPGPAALPVPVLERIRDEMLCLPGAGCSILEISHRDQRFLDILASAQSRVRELLDVPENYEILFLQGGARLQFSMIPCNLLRGSNHPAQYLISGSWGKYAIAEAVKEGNAEIIWDGKGSNYDRLPDPNSYTVNPAAAYLYYCSNETIQGVQFSRPPACPSSVPLICDASSDIFCRPVPIASHGVYYACAQKNAGPAGVTVVIVRKDLLERASDQLPGYLLWRNHAQENSEWNTPPTFAIYALDLICQWLLDDVGGLAEMEQRNQDKAGLLYEIMDEFPAMFISHAQKNARSLMNVTFRLPNEGLEKQFLSGASKAQLGNLKGHRSVGGIRASIYNAMPREGVQTLAQFMRDFARRHG